MQPFIFTYSCAVLMPDWFGVREVKLAALRGRSGSGTHSFRCSHDLENSSASASRFDKNDTGVRFRASVARASMSSAASRAGGMAFSPA